MSARILKGDRYLVVACLLLVAIAATGIISLRIAFRTDGHGEVAGKSITVLLPPPNLLRPISPQEALRDNASRSFVIRADSPAAPFRFAGNALSRDRAIECLTQAVYYEAAADGPQGERAVAQVILNRVRHPGFPSSICGVIYEGANAPGCQFTFTCDGSLGKSPAPALWKEAREIAVEELTGKVFAPVGHATHYHADYVLPYWADSLDKSVQIGHQIFYRLRGVFGNSAAFTQSYARNEPAPPAPPPTSAGPLQDIIAGEDPSETDPIAPAPHPQLAANSQLLADISAGALIGDSADRKAAAPAPQAGKAPANASARSNCEPASTAAPLRPLAANNLHSGQKPSCPD